MAQGHRLTLKLNAVARDNTATCKTLRQAGIKYTGNVGPGSTIVILGNPDARQLKVLARLGTLTNNRKNSNGPASGEAPTVRFTIGEERKHASGVWGVLELASVTPRNSKLKLRPGQTLVFNPNDITSDVRRKLEAYGSFVAT
ncbi:MAG: hypothetical protein JWN01_8 [Patescibacteria group bacterium]|nr:hypothetical protein [Patescibacteria group bacterium]